LRNAAQSLTLSTEPPQTEGDIQLSLRTKVKELLIAGAIGDVKSVHFEWLLDTNHGADYFRRWHREKRNSGGLMVYQSTDHFDNMLFW
jgi:predicted dehydrogenase